MHEQVDKKALWPQLRALFVAGHLMAVVLGALPAPEGGMQRSAWQDATVQEELSTWAERLRSLGMDLDDAAFQEGLWQVAVRFMQGREAVLAPFQPYYRLAGTHQSWRMFVAPHTHPARLHIDLREGDGWRGLYLERDPELVWMGRVLDQDRTRSLLFRYAWPSYGKAWRELCDWLGRKAARDFPQAEQLRLRFWKQRTPSAAEVRAGREPEGRFVRERIVDLPALRGR